MKWYGRVFTLLFTTVAWAQDPVELVRKSIAQDQLDWVRMKDYTWQAHSTERHFDARGKVESTKQEKWETLILDGQPYRRMLERAELIKDAVLVTMDEVAHLVHNERLGSPQ